MCVSHTDVPTWLKSLRLHKYAALFSTLTYDEMMSLTEEQLEAQVRTHQHTGGTVQTKDRHLSSSLTMNKLKYFCLSFLSVSFLLCQLILVACGDV